MKVRVEFLEKYVFPSHEKAKEMMEKLKEESEEFSGYGVGLLPVRTIDEGTEESVLTGEYQLDVVWTELTPEAPVAVGEDPSFDHPYGWKKYVVEVDGEGNHHIPGFSYKDHRLK